MAVKRVSSREHVSGRDGGIEGSVWLREGGILERWRYAIFAAVGVFLLLGLNGELRITPDAAVHVWIANRLLSGMGWAAAASWHVSIPRGLPMLIAWVFGVFGRENFWALNTVLMLFAWVCVFLTYRLVRFRLPCGPAVVVTVMFGVSLNLAEHTVSPLTDVPFLAGLLAAMLGWEYWQRARFAKVLDRGQMTDWVVGLLLVGFGALLMFWMRTVALTSAAAFFCACVVWVVRGPKRGVIGGALTVGVAALFAVRVMRSGSVLNFDEMGVWHRLTLQLPETLSRAWATYVPSILTEHAAIAMLGTDPGEKLGFLLFGLFLIWAIGMLFRMSGGGLWGWVALGYTLQFALFFTDVRYFLVLLPLLYLAWYVAVRWFVSHLRRDEALWRFALLIALLAVTNAVRVGDLWAEQRSGDFLAVHEKGRYALLLEEAAEMYPEVKTAGVLLVCEPAYIEGPIEWALQRVAFDRGDTGFLRGGGRAVTRERWEAMGRPYPMRELVAEHGGEGGWRLGPVIATP